MKKYDVRFSQGYDRSHSWRYQQRVEAKNEEDAKNKIIKECKKERPDEKVMNIRVNEAQDFICWTYHSVKNAVTNAYSFERTYYGGYLDLPVFGKTVMYESDKEKAKRFQTEYELKNEIKSVGRKITEYKIEKIKVE